MATNKSIATLAIEAAKRPYVFGAALAALYASDSPFGEDSDDDVTDEIHECDSTDTAIGHKLAA